MEKCIYLCSIPKWIDMIQIWYVTPPVWNISLYVSTVSQWPSDALNTETKINKWERWNKEQTGAEENLNFNVKSSEIRENIA